MPQSCSNDASGAPPERPAPPGAAPPVRGLPASEINATRTFPSAIAAAAWPRWNRYDEPPVSVESR